MALKGTMEGLFFFKPKYKQKATATVFLAHGKIFLKETGVKKALVLS